MLRGVVATSVVLVLLAVGVGQVSGAGLAVSTASLAALGTSTGAGAPTVVTWTAFTAPNGSTLAGRSLEGGGQWIVDAGSWTITGGAARAGSSTSNVRARTSGGSSTAAVSVTVTAAATSTAYRIGLIANSSGASYLIAEWRNSSGGQLRLRKVVNGTATTLVTASQLGRPSAATLRVESFSDVLSVLVNGAQVLTYTLTASERLTFKAATSTGFGVYASGDTSSTLDDFHIDLP